MRQIIGRRTRRKESCRTSWDSSSLDLFHFQLASVPQGDFGRSSILLDLAGHADSLFFQLRFRLTEFWPVRFPDHRGENRIWIWLVQVEECRLALGAISVARGSHDAANRSGLAQMILRFGSGDLRFGCCDFLGRSR